MKKLLTYTALGTVMFCSSAFASGFNLKEQSASAIGNAFAGATAGAEDISYSYFNPAGLTRHKGTQMNGGATWIAPRSKAKTAKSGQAPGGPQIPTPHETGYTGDIVHSAASPNFYMSHQLDDQWFVAMSMNTPYGMITSYDDNWAGRFHGTKSDVKTLTVTPMVAYKPFDKLSFGAGFQMQYIRAKLSNAQMTPIGEDHVKLEGDTLDIGYSLGALYEPRHDTRFGIGYRSQVKHKLKGKIDFGSFNPMDQDINARITTPANLTIGAYHDLNDKWSIMGEFGRTYWSSFKNLDIYGEGGSAGVGINSRTEERWKDTTFYALGTSYRYNDKWKFRAGIAVDQSAVGQSYRTPRIPDSDRLWYSGGVEYTLNEKTKLNVGYTYIRADKGKVDLDGTHADDQNRGTLNAKYENDVHILAMGINYEF